jgi:serine/threonine protein kinase
VIHCDLKSDNIFLDEDGMHAKVGDLGLAMQRDHATMYLSSIKSAAGTSMYMAPEVMRDEQYGRAADTYSYALVLYELLLHKRPYSPRFRKFSPRPPTHAVGRSPRFLAHRHLVRRHNCGYSLRFFSKEQNGTSMQNVRSLSCPRYVHLPIQADLD